MPHAIQGGEGRDPCLSHCWAG